MKRINSFALSKHAGPYETWPLETEMVLDGHPTGANIPGYVLEAQYQAGDRYLLVTSWDCPYEDSLTFISLSSDLRRLGKRSYGAAQASVCLKAHEPIGPKTVIFHLDNGFDAEITVRAKRPFLIGPYLKMTVNDRSRLGREPSSPSGVSDAPTSGARHPPGQ